MTGSIAEAYYGIDKDIKDTAFSYLDGYLLEIAEEFIKKFVTKNRRTRQNLFAKSNRIKQSVQTLFKRIVQKNRL